MRILYLILLLFVISGCEKEVSVTPPDAPPPSGKLVLYSYPEGFNIYVNGKYRLRDTPDSLSWLETGQYNITLKKDLFFDTTFTVDIVDGGAEGRFIDFSSNPRMQGDLSVGTKPAGSQIYINDSSTSKVTPYTFNNLLPGNYIVKLTAPNFETREITTYVHSGETTQLKGSLIDTTLWGYYNTENSGLYPDKLTCLTIDINDNIWIGSRFGVIKFDRLNWERFLPGYNKMPHQVVNSISSDDYGTTWIGTNSGIGIADFTTVYDRIVLASDVPHYAVYYDPTQKVVYWLLGALVFKHPIPQSNVKKDVYTGITTNGGLTSIWAKDKFAYVGSATDGLFVWDGNYIDSVVNYRAVNSNLPGNNISALYGNDEGVYIGISTSAGRSSALAKFDGTDFTKFTFLNPDILINTIYIDSNNFKWLGMDIGIYAFDEFENKKLLDEETTGLPLSDVVGIDEDSHGNIWIATRLNGIYEIKDFQRLFNGL